MRRAIRATIVLPLLLLGLRGLAQPAINAAQQQFMQERARSKVKMYADQLSAFVQAGEGAGRESIRQTIYQLLGKEKERTLVFNDLVPPHLPPLPASRGGADDSLKQLNFYLDDLVRHYPGGVKLSYDNFAVSDVLYNPNGKWFYVKVTADRTLDGMFVNGSTGVAHQAQDKVDFYVNAEAVSGEIRMGGIYRIQPQGLDAAPGVRPQITETPPGGIRLTGEPLQIKPETVPRAFKRGRAYAVEWRGGITDDVVQVELIPQDSARAGKGRSLGAIRNQNKIEFTPSSKDKLGLYRLRINNISTGRSILTDAFTIRRRIPLGVTLTAGPALVAAAVLVGRAIFEEDVPEPISDPPLPK
jgi:hypothetical protein